MTDTVVLNPDAWMAAVKDVVTAAPPDEYPDAITVRQFADIMNLGINQASVRLKQLVTADRAERVSKTICISNGIKRRVTAYRLLDTSPTKKSKRK